MSGADRYQEAGQHLADFFRTGNPLDMDAAKVQATLALAAATVLPLVVAHLGDTAAITDWAKMIAADVFEHAPARRYEPALDRHGDAMWLSPVGDVGSIHAGDAPQGWRRLYVEAATDGGEPS